MGTKLWRWSSIVVAPSRHQLVLQPAQRCTLHVVLLPPRSIRVHRVACQSHVHLGRQRKARLTGGRVFRQMAQRTNLFFRQCLVLPVRGWLCHTAHASSQKNPTTSLRSINIGAPKMNSHTDLFAGDWFFVPKWKAQAIVNFSK